jgi:hypothetical protein
MPPAGQSQPGRRVTSSQSFTSSPQSLPGHSTCPGERNTKAAGAPRSLGSFLGGWGVVRGCAEPRGVKVPRVFGNLTDFIPLGGNTALGIAPPWKTEFPIQNFLCRAKARGSALPAPHPPRKDPSAVNLPPWSSVSREVVTRPRSSHHHGRAAAQRLGIGPGDPGQPGLGRLTRTTQTPYNSAPYLALVRVVRVVRVKRQIVWEIRLGRTSPRRTGGTKKHI